MSPSVKFFAFFFFHNRLKEVVAWRSHLKFSISDELMVNCDYKIWWCRKTTNSKTEAPGTFFHWAEQKRHTKRFLGIQRRRVCLAPPDTDRQSLLSNQKLPMNEVVQQNFIASHLYLNQKGICLLERMLKQSVFSIGYQGHYNLTLKVCMVPSLKVLHNAI